MAIDKKASRLRRSRQTRLKHRASCGWAGCRCFAVNTHIYANIISPDGDKVLGLGLDTGSRGAFGTREQAGSRRHSSLPPAWSASGLQSGH